MDDRIRQGVDAHRVGQWKQESEDDRGGLVEGYLQALTESRLCARCGGDIVDVIWKLAFRDGELVARQCRQLGGEGGDAALSKRLDLPTHIANGIPRTMAGLLRSGKKIYAGLSALVSMVMPASMTSVPSTLKPA